MENTRGASLLAEVKTQEAEGEEFKFMFTCMCITVLESVHLMNKLLFLLLKLSIMLKVFRHSFSSSLTHDLAVIRCSNEAD